MIDLSKRKRVPRKKSELELSRRGVAFCLPLLSLLSFPVPAWAAPARAVRLESQKTHSRLIVNVDEAVNARFKEDGKGFELILPGLSLADLGAPLGEEARWLEQYEGIADARVSQVTLAESHEGGGAVKITGHWKFPAGKEELAHPQMEHFEYHEKSPPSYVVDLWVKPGPTVAQSQVKQKKTLEAKASQKSDLETKARVARRHTRETAKAEAEDITRFCRYPMTESSDVFLKFQPVHEKVDFSRWLSATTPDIDFPYYEPTGKERDAQYVRLALSLYRKGDFGLAVRALDFFDTEHPKSEFRREMRFLRANVLIKLGFPQQADPILTALMYEGRESPVALHCGMYRAAKLMQAGSYLASLESFLWLAERYPDHRLNWVFHFGAAETLYALRQTERAAKEYAWMIQHGPDRQAKAQGALRIGDLYLNRFQYEQALAAYFEAISIFGPEAKAFAPIAINRAETLYGLGQLDRAQEAFEDFLRRFPSHPSGWRATFRLGEVASRKSPATAATLAAARKHYYETVNRYPMSPGSTLARLRLLPCGDHAGFDLASAERFFFSEAADFKGDGQVSLQRYHDLVALTRVRSLLSLGEPLDAVDATIEDLQGVSDREVRTAISDLYAQLFRKTALGLLAQGKKYQALRFFREKASYLPKHQDAWVDPDFLVKLSQAASDLGLGKLAADLAADYNARVAKDAGRSVATADQGKDLDQILKVSEQNFAQAKALWITAGGTTGAQIHAHSLELIRGKLELVSEESPFYFEREILLGLIEEKAGKATAALAHAIRAQLVAQKPDLGLNAWLAGLEHKAGDFKVALELYKSLEPALKARKPAAISAGEESTRLGVPSAPSLERVVLAQGEILEAMKEWGQAALTYERAMTGGLGGNQAVYGYANAVLESGGNRAKAYETLEKLAGSKPPQGEAENFWKRLARERLANERSREAISKQ